MGEYINFPIVTDQETLSENAIAYLKARIPTWEAQPGSFETWLIEALAALASDTRDVSSDVPASIFRYFGAKLVGIGPIDEQHSTVASTWVVQDTLGYTIEEGTVVSIRNDLNEEIPFEVVNTVAIAPGVATTGTGEVLLISVSPGLETAGLGGAGILASLVDPLDYVISVTLTAFTSGGVDAEQDELYLARLSERLQLLADRPILAKDYEIMAKQVVGVDRVISIDNFVAGTNEKQTVVHTATAGTFTLVFEGQTTAAINWNEINSVVKTKLEALSNIAVDDVVITGGPLPTLITVEFVNNLATSNRTQMTIGTNSLTGGGGAGSLVIATTVGGVADVTNAERAVGIVAIDSNGNAIGSVLKAEVDTLLQSKREINFLVGVFDPVYNTISVTFAAKAYAEFDLADVESRAEAAVTDYLNPKNWGVLPFGDAKSLINTKIVRYLEVAQVINNVEGLSHITTLTVNGGTVDITMLGAVSLTLAGTIAGTVTY